MVSAVIGYKLDIVRKEYIFTSSQNLGWHCISLASSSQRYIIEIPMINWICGSVVLKMEAKPWIALHWWHYTNAYCDRVADFNPYNGRMKHWQRKWAQNDVTLPILQCYEITEPNSFSMGQENCQMVGCVMPGFSCHLYVTDISSYLIVEALRLSPTCSRL